MKAEEIKKILDNHSIQYMEIKEGYIVAFEEYKNTRTGNFGIEFVDVTGWSKKQLFQWLGY